MIGKSIHEEFTREKIVTSIISKIGCALVLCALSALLSIRA
jgi:hypothetical protein